MRKSRIEGNLEWNSTISGVIKGYSSHGNECEVLKQNVVVNDAVEDTFVMFGAYGEKEKIYRPDMFVISSINTKVVVIAKPKWEGDFPRVESVDIIEAEKPEYSLIPIDETYLESLQKLSFTLRFKRLSIPRRIFNRIAKMF